MSIITISKANFLTFRKQGETLKTFDNTLSVDEDFPEVLTFDRCPVKVLSSDRIKFQVKAEDVADLAMTLTLVQEDNSRSIIGMSM